MQKKLSSGFGYIKRGEKIVGKFEFPSGSTHKFQDGDEVIELNTRQEMLQVQLEPPVSVGPDPLEILIREKMESNARSKAIADLKLEGKLPPNFDDKPKEKLK